MNRALDVMRSPRAGVALLLVSVGWVASAQQTAAPRPPTAVTANFTGSVASLDASDVRSVRFQYAAGARSHWHSHSGIQVLTLEQGHGRAQVQGQKMQDLLPGGPVLEIGIDQGRRRPGYRQQHRAGGEWDGSAFADRAPVSVEVSAERAWGG